MTDETQFGPFTSLEVGTIVGLQFRKLIQYEERGLISPSIQKPRGRGSKRLWSYEDVIRCAVVKHLGSGGIALDFLRAVMVRLSDQFVAPDMVAFVRFPVGLKRLKGGAIIWPPDEHMPLVVVPIQKPNSGRKQVAFRPDDEEEYEKTTLRSSLERFSPCIFIDFERMHAWVQDQIRKKLPVS